VRKKDREGFHSLLHNLQYRGDQERLFALAMVAGFTQVDIARHVGMSKQNFNRYTSGARELPEHLFEEILQLIFSETGEAFEDKKIG